MDRPYPTAGDSEAAALAKFDALWQPELSIIQATLESGWRPYLEQVLAEHAAHHVRARKGLTEKLAQHMRRMRQFENERQWSEAALDAAQLGCARAILFSVAVDKLRFQASRGFDNLKEFTEVAFVSAGAFASAVASGEPVTALKTRTELSEALTAVTGENPAERIAVFPIKVRQRVAAVLYAEGGEAPILDLVATFAGAALESHMATQAASRSSTIVSIASAAGTPFVTREDEEWHLRAQRFARVQAAEIRLYHSEAVKRGRANKDLYGALKPQLDAARRAYEERYLQGAPHMADYLHQEILRTLANGDVELLGPDYPIG